ncbi:unnamed protein product, partial [marine sediment metagenome]
ERDRDHRLGQSIDWPGDPIPARTADGEPRRKEPVRGHM